MTVKRLNNCFLLHVHKELTDSINVTDVAVPMQMMNAPDTLVVLLVLCNFSSNEIIIILFRLAPPPPPPNIIRFRRPWSR